MVDDEKKIVELVAAYLEKEGYEVIAAFDGREALRLARREKPDLIVLDLLLPEINGLDVCRRVRREGDIPIIMLTAKVEEIDRVTGLELGADDYLTKPFSPRELVARVNAVLRRLKRQPEQLSEEIKLGRLAINLARHEAKLDGRSIDLTPTEFKLLRVLAMNPGRVFSRLQLLDQVQGEAFDGYERTIDTHIKNLRRKIKQHPENHYIKTVYGFGYMLEVSDDS